MPLWIVATPIGTLADLSSRAAEVMRDADVIAAEDTRTTRRLLNAREIPAPHLIALHAHNEDRQAQQLVDRALNENVILVSDAGTPAISDPGQRLVALALAAGVEIRSVPGPSALATALAATGFPAAPSSFLGFPPRKGRDGWARTALERSDTLVMYEAPTRVADLCKRLALAAPHREAVLCRELSKKYEEVVRAPLPELARLLSERESIRGECVLVVGPGTPLKKDEASVGSGSLKAVAAVLAERWGIKRREAYQRLLALEAEHGTEGTT